jgi:uncharacterized protein
MKKEVRTFTLRAYDGGQPSDPQMTLRGRAITYGALSSDLGGFKERFAPGAFTRALASGDDCHCLFNHDQNFVLGRVANGTLKLTDSRYGLDFACVLDPANQMHRNLYSSIKRGDIDSCSFAFTPDGDDAQDWDEATDDDGTRFQRRTVKRANLFDVSAVTRPAYPGSHVDARKSLTNVPTRRGGKSVEQWFFEKHGVWPRNKQQEEARTFVALAQSRHRQHEFHLREIRVQKLIDETQRQLYSIPRFLGEGGCE